MFNPVLHIDQTIAPPGPIQIKSFSVVADIDGKFFGGTADGNGNLMAAGMFCNIVQTFLYDQK